MKMSGTKPMKNTMRKSPPMKQTSTTKTTKPTAPEGKPNASTKPTGRKAIDTVKKVAATATKGAVKSALMQLKKHKK